MNVLRWLREHRRGTDEWWARWQRDHHWDRLADYNSRVGRGIVHTSEYAARMREEQQTFDAEQAARDGIR